MPQWRMQAELRPCAQKLSYLIAEYTHPVYSIVVRSSSGAWR
jgi:hypothetical protein